MAFYATVTLSRGAETLVIPAPRPGYSVAVERAQGMGQSAAGNWYVYDKEVVTYTASLQFELSATQKASAVTFFNNSVLAALNTFTFVDHHNTTHNNARLQQGSLRFEKSRAQRFVMSLTMILQEAMG